MQPRRRNGQFGASGEHNPRKSNESNITFGVTQKCDVCEKMPCQCPDSTGGDLKLMAGKPKKSKNTYHEKMREAAKKTLKSLTVGGMMKSQLDGIHSAGKKKKGKK